MPTPTCEWLPKAALIIGLSLVSNEVFSTCTITAARALAFFPATFPAQWNANWCP
jgi:hypothetical protein